MSRLVASDNSDQAVVNTTTETNVAVLTIPSGTWVGNAVLLEQTGFYENNNQNSRTCTTRLYIGSTSGSGGTKVSEITSPAQAASTLKFAQIQRWDLVAFDSSTLHVTHRLGFGAAGSDTGNLSTPTTPSGFNDNRVTGLSLSGAVEIRITEQLSATGANHRFTSHGVRAALLTPAVAATTYTQAEETDSAQGSGVKLGFAFSAETDSSRSFASKLGYGFAGESEQAGTFSISGSQISYSFAIETDSARGFAQKAGYSRASETDEAGVFFSGSIGVPVRFPGHATPVPRRRHHDAVPVG